MNTTTAAEFRQVAEAAQAAGRLAELIAVVEERLERHYTTLQLYKSTQDTRGIAQTKKMITNLENKLTIAKMLAE